MNKQQIVAAMNAGTHLARQRYAYDTPVRVEVLRPYIARGGGEWACRFPDTGLERIVASRHLVRTWAEQETINAAQEADRQRTELEREHLRQDAEELKDRLIAAFPELRDRLYLPDGDSHPYITIVFG